MNDNNLIETIQYKGHEIKVCYDTNASSPDEWGNDDMFLVYDHRDFAIERDGFDPQDIFYAMGENKPLYKGYFYFPVYAYIHSGVALSLGRSEYPFNDGWDVSFRGFALIKRQKGLSYRRKKAYEIVKSLIEEWNQYLSGDVYGYTSDCGSCWDFYGEEGKQDMIKQAKDEIDYKIERSKKSILTS
jgi:hypothetical protein